MSDTAIKIINLGKVYRIGLKDQKHETLGAAIGSFLKAPFNNFKRLKNLSNIDSNNESNDVFWALKNISFDVKKGEVIGIIGKNGAGKSTLLKILSQITEPSVGKIEVYGRVASLLEVGTGFNPELTGRENVYLNGTILGMRKKEIDNKFQQIVEFSGVEKFIDTPVKRYSSGMRVRLAFAVAAHLESEILIIDEVLAVGDAEFQKKCLGKIGDVASNEGRTVLFVSHNMAAVKSLCSRAVMLESGKLTIDDEVDNVIASYLTSGFQYANHKTFSDLKIEDIEIQELKINALGKSPEEPIIEGEEIQFLTKLFIKNNACDKYHITYQLYNDLGEVMFAFSHHRDGIPLKNGSNHLVCKFPEKFFNTGSFYISLLIVRNRKEVILIEKDILTFTILSSQKEIGNWMGRSVGFLKPAFIWEHKI